jgi:hypothetical protein
MDPTLAFMAGSVFGAMVTMGLLLILFRMIGGSGDDKD